MSIVLVKHRYKIGLTPIDVNPTYKYYYNNFKN